MMVQANNELAQLNRDLVLLTKAANAIDDIMDLNDVLKIRDQAEALKLISKRHKLSTELAVQLGVIKVKAERRIGEFIQSLDFHKGGRPSVNQDANRSQHDTGSLTLKELGITKSDSSRWKQMAELPKKDFNAFVHGEQESNRPPTTASVMREVKRFLAVERAKADPEYEGFVTNLQGLVDQGIKYSSILCDFPWPYRNKSGRGACENHYPTMTIDQLAELPIPALSSEKALLFLWTTSSFLPESIQLIEGYGFSFKSSFIWTKPSLGVGNYWRISHEILTISSREEVVEDHEFLLLGTKLGEPFQDTNFRSWQEYPRLAHSEKPEEIRQMICQVGLPNRLELFGRKVVPGWTVFGNQVIGS